MIYNANISVEESRFREQNTKVHSQKNNVNPQFHLPLKLINLHVDYFLNCRFNFLFVINYPTLLSKYIIYRQTCFGIPVVLKIWTDGFKF